MIMRMWILLSLLMVAVVGQAQLRDYTVVDFREDKKGVADVAQYVPTVFPWALKLCGEPTRSGWGRMATSHAFTGVLMAGSVSLLKDNVSSIRPDGTDNRSFPSGHSAWVYMGATITARELGWRSPWYTMGAYSVASAVAMQRVVDRRHLPQDVATGAAIGVLATQAGYYLADLIWGGRQLDNPFGGVSDSNEYRFSLSLYNRYSISLCNIKSGSLSIGLSQGFEGGVKASIPIAGGFGVSPSIGFRSVPVFIKSGASDIYVAPLNTLIIAVAPQYNIILSDVVSISAEAGCFFNHNLSLKSLNRAVKMGNSSFGVSAGAGVAVRLTDDFSIGADIGYESKRYEAEVSPSEIYGIGRPQKISKQIGSLNIGVAAQVAF